jgi:glycosyltransferase involved in cell wall biosynthesis
MACGTPVITSGSYAMPETAGDAAMMINPESPESIANAIEKLSNNNELMQSYKAKGLERVKQFSWNSSARQLVQLYHSILSGSVTKEQVQTNAEGKKKGQPAYTN